MKFLKYEMLPAEWDTLKATIQVTDSEGNTSWDPAVVVAVHEIGHICQQWGTDAEGNQVCEVESPNWAVDILWVDAVPADFDAYVVWPLPVGIHTFAGWEQEYAKEYCIANPDAEYCQPPAPIEG